MSERPQRPPMPHPADCAPRLRGWIAFADSETKRADAREAELHSIDSVLARRAALDGLSSRYEKVLKAIQVAATVDPNDAIGKAREEAARKIEAHHEAAHWTGECSCIANADLVRQP
jgi:hypothetical protein